MAEDNTNKTSLKGRPRSPSPPELKESNEESIDAPKSDFKEFLIQNLLPQSINYQIKLKKNGKNLKILNQGKVFTISTGVAVSRVTSIVLASLTIAGLASPHVLLLPLL